MMNEYVPLVMGSAVGATAFVWMLYRIRRYNHRQAEKQAATQEAEKRQRELPFDRAEEPRQHELVGHM